jgi:hypothetical protein
MPFARRATTRLTIDLTYGMIYGVKRTTIYLPEELKSTLARAAEEEGRSEADLIREGVELLLRSRNPEPRLPLFTSGKPDLAENVEELLAGFGEE